MVNPSKTLFNPSAGIPPGTKEMKMLIICLLISNISLLHHLRFQISEKLLQTVREHFLLRQRKASITIKPRVLPGTNTKAFMQWTVSILNENTLKKTDNFSEPVSI